MRKSGTIGSLLVGLLLTFGSASANDRWLHVRVDEGGPRGEKVHVNIPLNVVEIVLPMIAVDELRHGKLHLDAGDFEGLDLEGLELREILTALLETPDTDFVTVQAEHEKVRVAKEGDYLIVRVEETGRRSAETVRVRMPLAVVQALVGGEPGELDLVAGLRVLSEFEGEDLVSIDSEDTTVRVWIDSREDGR